MSKGNMQIFVFRYMEISKVPATGYEYNRPACSEYINIRSTS